MISVLNCFSIKLNLTRLKEAITSNSINFCNLFFISMMLGYQNDKTRAEIFTETVDLIQRNKCKYRTADWTMKIINKRRRESAKNL
jgi:hypothetical protein